MPWKIEKHKGSGTHYVRAPLILFVSLLVMIVGLAVLLWSSNRGRDPRLQVKQPGDFAALLPSLVGLTQASLDTGNEAKLLENGDQLFPSLLADIAAARQSVHVETFVWWKGPICDKVPRPSRQKPVRESKSVCWSMHRAGARWIAGSRS